MGRAFGGSGKVRRLGFSQETTQQRLVNRRTSTHIRIKEYEERIDEGEELEVFEKAPAVKAAIKEILATSFLFKDISKETMEQVVDVMRPYSYKAGERIIEQGAPPSKEDNMYFIETGTLDILIKGNQEDEHDFTVKSKMDGQTELVRLEKASEMKVASKKDGEVFGDVALLFASKRSASVVCAGDAKLWGLSRKAFAQVVTKYSLGTKKLRFLRHVPLFQGLSDNTLREIAPKLNEQVLGDGEIIIKEGDYSSTLYIIETGEVAVTRKMGEDKREVELHRFKPLEFFGERTFVTGKARTASCIAKGGGADGGVRLWTLNKEDFSSIKPLLQHVLDDQMIFTVLKDIPQLEALAETALEEVIDKFVEKKAGKGDVIISAGDAADKIFIVKSGTVHAFFEDEEGKEQMGKEFMGYSCFGYQALLSETPQPTTIRVTSEEAQIFHFGKEHFFKLLGPLASLQDTNDMISLLKDVPTLKLLTEKQITNILSQFKIEKFKEGDAIIKEGEDGNKYYVIRKGEVVVTKQNKESGMVDTVATMGRGDQFGERALITDEPRVASIFASTDCECLTLTRSSFEEKLGRLRDLMEAEVKLKESTAVVQGLRNSDLEFHRVIGAGQFGKVHLVQHKFTKALYALKKISKLRVIQLGQEDHICNEEAIISAIKSDFAVRHMKSFHDENYLYIMMEMVQGGELFYHLDMEGHFPNDKVKFYAANVLLALENFHSNGIVYRDLKPENILIEKNGYLKITDFGFAKKIDKDRAYTLCGTPDYHPPEIIRRAGHTYSADFWALGILIFELLSGEPPFSSPDGNAASIFEKILVGVFDMPLYIDEQAQDLIYGLLEMDPSHRLGSGKLGAGEIKRHPWFADIDWVRMENQVLPAPYIPKLETELDMSNFDDFDWMPDPEVDPGMADAGPWTHWDKLE